MALRLVVTLGYSYAEAAKELLGDAAKTRQIDGLLTRGKRKLALAWEGRRRSRGKTESSTFTDRAD